jgi:hypothetical protein
MLQRNGDIEGIAFSGISSIIDEGRKRDLLGARWSIARKLADSCKLASVEEAGERGEKVEK